MEDRIIKLLNDDIAKKLVSQLGHELKNYTLYKSFSNFFRVKGLVDLQTYFNIRAHEELEHSEWIYRYLSNADHQFVYPHIEFNDDEFDSLVDPFILTVKREIETTTLIYEIYKTASEENDYMTVNWLDSKLIPEQTEEENTSRLAQTLMEQDGVDILTKAKKILGLVCDGVRSKSETCRN